MKSVFKIAVSQFLFIFTLFNTLQAQAFLESFNPDDFGADFLALAKKIDLFYDAARPGQQGGYKQWKRMEWFATHHLGSNGQSVNSTALNVEAYAGMKRSEPNSGQRVATGLWYNIGHSTTSSIEAHQGRVNCIAFDPIFNETAYLASAGGGLWKTINNGDSWFNITPDLPILGYGDIAVGPSTDNNVVYAMSGDQSSTLNVYQHPSIGVIKSIDGGISWKLTTLTFMASNTVNSGRLLIHPTNVNDVLASTGNGIFRTLDGGATWTMIDGNVNVNDMEFQPGNPSILYYTIPFSNLLFIRNLVTGTVSTTTINAPVSIRKMEIGVTPANPLCVYVVCGPSFIGVDGTTNLFNGLYYSNNGGGSFTQQAVTTVGNNSVYLVGGNDICWYANAIGVDPYNEANVYLGGVNAFLSSDFGVTLFRITDFAIHSDQHNIKINPLNGNIWLCCDGGVYKSDNSGANFINKSEGLVINEYYRISSTADEMDHLLGGLQDNDVLLREEDGNFLPVIGGDGMDNYFNVIYDTIAYACTQNGQLYRSINGGYNWILHSLPGGGGSNYPWLAPIVQFPPTYNVQSGQWEDVDYIFVYSKTGIMRCLDGGTWTNIGPPNIGQPSGTLTPSMVICRDSGGANLYISNGNGFWVCTNPTSAPSWNAYSLPISPNTIVSGLAVNPVNKLEVWATIGGYSTGTKVFRSTDGGMSWSNFSGSLPNIPIYCITFGSPWNIPTGSVYIGTEMGVYYKDDNVPDWIPFYNGLPHVPVTDLEINWVTAKIKAATYGRGIWESDLYTSCDPLVGLYFPIENGQYSFESSDLAVANSTVSGGIETTIRIKAANQIQLLPGFHIFQDAYMRLQIGDCGSGPVPLQNPVPQKMTSGKKLHPRPTDFKPFGEKVSADEDED